MRHYQFWVCLLTHRIPQIAFSKSKSLKRMLDRIPDTEIRHASSINQYRIAHNIGGCDSISNYKTNMDHISPLTMYISHWVTASFFCNAKCKRRVQPVSELWIPFAIYQYPVSVSVIEHVCQFTMFTVFKWQ